MVNVNMDKNLQKQAEVFFSEIGLDLGTAMTMLVAQTLKRGENPFTNEYRNGCASQNSETEERQSEIEEQVSDEDYKEYLLKTLKERFGMDVSKMTDLTWEELEDIHDVKAYDEAYAEYVKDGCKSRPIKELFKELGFE